MDVIVIGSGFGGAIAAQLFTAAGHRVTILELGEDWRPPHKAIQTQDPRFVFRLMRNYPTDFPTTRPGLLVTLGMGFGGGSLVYSGIHLRAPAQAFTPWPDGWTRAHLDPYYARVERKLSIAPLPDALLYPRTKVFAQGAAAAGLPPPVANPLAMRGCTKCGWCIPICTFDKKQTMQHTYLAEAVATGKLTVLTQRKAAYIVRAGKRYRVAFWRTDGVRQDYHRVSAGPLASIEGDLVVVAGGAIESPVLLERSLALPAVPAGTQRLAAFPTARLGAELDGSGDFVQGGFVPQRVDGFKGAVMMAHIELGDFMLEDIQAVPAASAITLDNRFGGVHKGWGRAYKHSFRDFDRHVLAIGIVGKQGPGTERNISVRDDGGNALVSTRAYAPPIGSLEAARAMIRGLGGTPVATPWETTGTAFTVHPTGGCAMGAGPDAVVRSRDLQVQGNPNLYVIDGSVLPGNPMRNPSHTIAAVAERALDIILGATAPDRWPTEVQ